MTFPRVLLALAFACAAAPAVAQSQPKAVVELFTSQGCGSCPPADVLLGELAQDPQVIALSMPVDYWDYIGWKDTLALHGHSLRQKAYADQRADHKVFTPQAVVDGVQAVKGSDRAALKRAILAEGKDAAALSVPIQVTRKDDLIEISLPAGNAPASKGAELWACPVAREKSVAIDRGENSGRNMTYANVVRGWIRVGSWDGTRQSHQLKVSELKRYEADSLAVLLQTGTAAAPGAILGAALLPLE